MGNMCAPRTVQQTNPKAQNPYKTPQKQTKIHSEVNRSPRIPAAVRISRYSIAVQDSCQNNPFQNAAKNLQEKPGKYVDVSVKCNKNGNISINSSGITDSQLSKKRPIVNIINPSQVRDSLVSAWNKTNFDQSCLFKHNQYSNIFLTNPQMHNPDKISGESVTKQVSCQNNHSQNAANNPQEKHTILVDPSVESNLSKIELDSNFYGEVPYQDLTNHSKYMPK